MPRVKTGTKRVRRHKKVLSATKGYKGTRSKLFKRANEAYVRAGEHAFAGRRIKRRDLRSLWILRIGAALKPFDLKYSAFIALLSKEKVLLNRKVLSEMATNYPQVFEQVVKKVNLTK
ncbi:50S ribosomal protein L20 [Candidatus Parcubacteria bacterium]|nr:50S ribosomal protein L20 [Patescibacteria group bacterium]MBU4380890.1 50S ribosomal protein L20 [Patescibacteria group bacterium]MCG2688941.1 50S ribosomal protein L20 [Candidatus Parcubacteria bacterium]